MSGIQQTDDEIRAAFNLGVNVRTTVRRPARNQQPSGPTLTRKIVNCLSCGKVYDCRHPTADAAAFLNQGGRCTFCKKLVRLDYSDGSTNFLNNNGGDDKNDLEGFIEKEERNAAFIEENNGQEDSDKNTREQQAAAMALRDRLVEYDRESARRTTVIDDQSDYYDAVDGNAWLNDGEKAALKKQARDLEAAREERRRKMTVTVDLLGRRVLLDDKETNLEKLNIADGGCHSVEAVGFNNNNETTELATRAIEATAREKPQGGGTAAIEPMPRIMPCPGIAAAGYVFLKREAGGGGRRDKTKVTSNSSSSSSKNVVPSRIQDEGRFFVNGCLNV